MTNTSWIKSCLLLTQIRNAPLPVLLRAAVLLTSLSVGIANADRMFDERHLQALQHEFEDAQCLEGCETMSWTIEAAQFPANSQNLVDPSDVLFVVIGKFPEQCGASRCIVAYVLRDKTHLIALASGHNLDGITAADIPPSGARNRLPHLARAIPASNSLLAASSEPSLQLTVSAMGITYSGGIVELKVPKDISEKLGIEVTFNAIFNDVTASIQSRYQFHWSINNERFITDEPQITQTILAGEPTTLHEVIVKIEKLDDMRTALSTPSMIDNSVISEASTLLSILRMDEWNCKGRLGAGCYDGDIKNTITTPVEVLSDSSPDCPKGRICIRSQMTSGSIRHDRCCEEHPNGKRCGGSDSDRNYSGELNCELEWNQAVDERTFIHLVSDVKPFNAHIWIYPPDGTDLPSAGIKGQWWKNILSSGTVVSYDKEKPEKKDWEICQSGQVELANVGRLPYNNLAASLLVAEIENDLWVCSDNQSKPNENLDLKHCAETASAYCFIMMALQEVESENVLPGPGIRGTVFADAAALLSEAKYPEEAQRSFDAARATIGKIPHGNSFWLAKKNLVDKLQLVGRHDEAHALLSELDTDLQTFSGDENAMAQREYRLSDVAAQWSRLGATARAERSINAIPSWVKKPALVNVAREEALAKRWDTARSFADRLSRLYQVSALCEIVIAAGKAGERELAVALVSEARQIAEHETNSQKLLGYGDIVLCQAEAGLDDLVSQMIVDIDTLSLSVKDRYRVRNAQLDAAKALHKLGDTSGAEDRLTAIFTEVITIPDAGRRNWDLGEIAIAQARLGMFEDAVKTMRHIMPKPSSNGHVTTNIRKAILDSPDQVPEQAIVMLRNIFTEAKDMGRIDHLHAIILARKGDINGALAIIQRNKWKYPSSIFLEIAQTILSARP